VALPLWLHRILRHFQVPYEIRHHSPAFTAQQLAEAEHVSGHRVAKTVLLASGSHPVSVVLPAPSRLDLQRVQEVLGGEPLRFAQEEEIAAWFTGCPPGAVPPLRLRSDHRILMDRSLAHLGKVLFPAGSLEEAVVVPFRAWYRGVRPGVGRFAESINGQGEVKPPRVLVVEDEAATNELFCRFLEMAGFSCVGVLEGNRAVTMATEMQPSAILLDLMLPDISGYEVCEKLRRIGPLRRIPFIVATALDDAASRQRCKQLGAEAYLTKPFHPDALAAELRGLLADAQA
jgi:CheY-like chemotaxis protein/prolyl-tRNA editing enzyme YbaK/EbsC (Cys-tRNA(Pro) deacylase)